MRWKERAALTLAALIAASPALAGRHMRHFEKAPNGCVSVSKSRVTNSAYYGEPAVASGYFGWPAIYFTSDGQYDRTYRPRAYSAADVYAPEFRCDTPRLAAPR